jgi:hypothetical protein
MTQKHTEMKKDPREAEDRRLGMSSQEEQRPAVLTIVPEVQEE